MSTSHPSTVSTTVAGKSFTASASPPQSNLVERVYSIIDDLCLKASGPVWLSQKDLAQTLEVTPRTINRVISRLKQSGRLVVTKTGSDMSYLTARESAQLPMVSAIAVTPSPRSRSSTPKPASPPQPATSDKHQMDDHATTDSQPVDSATTANGQAIDNQWTTNGQAMDRRWTGDGLPIDDPETPDSQPVDNLATCDSQPMDSPDGNQAVIVWKQALADISNQLPPGSFRSFFANTVGIKFDGDSLVVAVPSARAVEWLERPLHQEIAENALELVTGREMKVQYLEDPTISKEVRQHDAEPSRKTSPEPLHLSPCPRCGPDTMTLTTWPSLRRLSGQTYYCRGAGACSRLWNSIVGEFHPPGEEQLDPGDAKTLLSRALQNGPRSHH